MAVSAGRRIINRSKRELAERVLGQALGLLGSSPDKNAKYVISAVDHFAKGPKQEIIRDWIRGWLAEGKPGRDFLARMLKNTHPNVRRRYIARMIVSLFFRDRALDQECLEKHGG